MSLSPPNSRVFIIAFLMMINTAHATVHADTAIKSNEAYEEKMCERLSRLQFPKTDLPTAKDLKDLEGCSPRDLYFGINVPQDYVKARKCAFFPYLGNPHGEEMQGVLGSSDILTMVYANGKKVKRNLDLASKIVCDTRNDTFVNSNTSIKFLQNLKRSSHHKDFNVCSAGTASKNEISDPNTHHALTSVCSDLDVDIRNSDAALLIKKITTKYTTAQKRELNLLLVKATDFFERHVEEETKISQSYPSISSANMFDEIESYRNKSELQNSLINSIYLFEQGQFPGGSKQEYTKVLADFNKQFNEIKTLYADNQLSFSKHVGMAPEANTQSENEIQAAWVAYSDQFIKFAAMRYTQVPEYKWKMWLMKQRITQLKQYLLAMKLELSYAQE